MNSSLAGACLRPLGHLSGTRLIHGNTPDVQGLSGFLLRKVSREQAFSFLRLSVAAVRERVVNVGTNPTQLWSLFVLASGEMWGPPRKARPSARRPATAWMDLRRKQMRNLLQIAMQMFINLRNVTTMTGTLCQTTKN